MNSQGNCKSLLGTKVTWEHLGDQMAQVNTPRTTLISNSVITMFPKEILRTVIKGPMTHAWKGTDKFLLAPQRKPGCDVGAGTTVERGVKKAPGHWVLSGPQQ